MLIYSFCRKLIDDNCRLKSANLQEIPRRVLVYIRKTHTLKTEAQSHFFTKKLALMPIFLNIKLGPQTQSLPA